MKPEIIAQTAIILVMVREIFQSSRWKKRLHISKNSFGQI